MATKTPVSALQELMAARKVPLPVYIEEGFGTSFKCTVHAGGITAVGLSSSKKSAKHESAKKALEKFAMQTKTPQILILQTSTPPSPVARSFTNHVGELNEFASKRGLQYPNYECVTGTATGEFYVKCSFLEKDILGKGMNKKDAKQDAAGKMLELINVTDPVILINNSSSVINQTVTKFEVTEREKIVGMYKVLSLNDDGVYVEKTNTIKAIPEIIMTDHDSVDVLKAKLIHHGINYSMKELQNNPCIMYVRIKGTDLYFVACGDSREEATRRVLQDVFEAVQSGVSLSTNDLINFD
ncbi:uncharacterized protein LOC135125150 [Zophobas morio]|uniref:uncharacterized protein LOC135125150 n=1 Tax=Zophobas morio TaxID=2755281 RepID=UPI003082899B